MRAMKSIGECVVCVAVLAVALVAGYSAIGMVTEKAVIVASAN